MAWSLWHCLKSSLLSLFSAGVVDIKWGGDFPGHSITGDFMFTSGIKYRNTSSFIIHFGNHLIYSLGKKLKIDILLKGITVLCCFVSLKIFFLLF